MELSLPRSYNLELPHPKVKKQLRMALSARLNVVIR